MVATVGEEEKGMKKPNDEGLEGDDT